MSKQIAACRVPKTAHMSAYVEMLVLLHVDDQPYKAGVSVVQAYSLDNSSQPCLDCY